MPPACCCVRGAVASLPPNPTTMRLTRLAASEAGRRPDLIVCDYHLSRGVTGVDAVKRLRRAFEIPALLITGDAGSPPAEASSGGYHLLHKPVNAEAFRAALVDACVLQR